MFDWYRQTILRKIQKTERKKLLISIGDSFTQGQGAYSEKLWEKCNWDVSQIHQHSTREYEISMYENSFVHQLCKTYMKDYIPINLGLAGKGNRYAVKELHLYPEINFDDCEDIIVIFMLTGMERFDFVDKNFTEQQHFTTMWPAFDPQGIDDESTKKLWMTYMESIYSDRFAIVELLLNVAEVKTWCKANNAKLILSSAFRADYTRDNFIDKILGDLSDPENKTFKNLEYVENLVDIIDWENFLRPEGYKCFSDYLLHLENRDDLIDDTDEGHRFHKFGYTHKKLSPKKYITNCAHPSFKGHCAIADVLNDYILKNINKKPLF